MVGKGSHEKGKKLSIPETKNRFRKKHPDRYNIPTTHYIKQHVKYIMEDTRSIEAGGKEIIGDRKTSVDPAENA